MVGSANYMTDGLALTDDKTYLNVAARQLLQLVTHFVRQAPLQSGFRVDRKLFLSSLSSIVDNVRTAADDWELGPGWTGEDTKVGKTYSEVSDLSDEDLHLLHVSDTNPTAPYGNSALLKQQEEWNQLQQKYARFIPLCHVTKETSIKDWNEIEPVTLKKKRNKGA